MLQLFCDKSNQFNVKSKQYCISRDAKKFCLPHHNAVMIYIANLSHSLMFFIYKYDDDWILAVQNIQSTMIAGRAYTCTQVHENSFLT